MRVDWRDPRARGYEIKDAATGVFLDGPIVWADDRLGQMWVLGTDPDGKKWADDRLFGDDSRAFGRIVHRRIKIVPIGQRESGSSCERITVTIDECRAIEPEDQGLCRMEFD